MTSCSDKKPRSRPSRLSLLNSDETTSVATSCFLNKSFCLRRRTGECWQRTRFVLVRSTTAFFCPKIIWQQCIATIIYLKTNRLRPHSAVSACAAQSSCWALMWQLYKAEKTNVHYLTPGKSLTDITRPCTLWPQCCTIAQAFSCAWFNSSAL